MAGSIKSGLAYRKVSAMFAPPPLDVVREDRLWMTSKALLSLARPQPTRFLFVLVTYALVLSGSLWLSYQLRFDFDVPREQTARMYSLMAWIIPMKIAILFVIAELDGLLSYFSIPDLERLFLSLTASLFILAVLWWTSNGVLAPPRGVMVADLIVSFLALSAVRLFFRMARERFASPAQHLTDRAERVGIIGAGDVGASLARELSTKRHLGLEPVAFFDEDATKWGARIHNIRIVGAPECLLREKTNLKLDKIILAIPSSNQRRFREIVELLERIQIPFESVPAFDQLATGKVKITQLRSIRPDDLFGDTEPNLDLPKIREMIAGKSVMVTGAGGSIGGELCRRLASFGPSKLLLLDQCEVHLFQIEQEMILAGHKELIVPLVADIRDAARLRRLFCEHRPVLVLHAAAHKHAALLEEEPAEAIQTNALGALKVAELAIEFGVERFVLISSNRAARPRTVMGATKRLAEAAVHSLFAHQNKIDALTVVRFGELTDSASGVLQRLNKEIAAGGPVRIPQPNTLCYSMTTAQAAGLILQCMVLASKHALFVLDMGHPIRLLDLAYKAIEFSGLTPDQDIEIEFGRSRGDDETALENDARGIELTPSDHPQINQCAAAIAPWETLSGILHDLTRELHRAEGPALKCLLERVIKELSVEPRSDADTRCGALTITP